MLLGHLLVDLTVLKSESGEKAPSLTHKHTPNHEYLPARQKEEVDRKTAG